MEASGSAYASPAATIASATAKPNSEGAMVAADASTPASSAAADAAIAAAVRERAPQDIHPHVSLLEVQSEQLAVKLQGEEGGGSGRDSSVGHAVDSWAQGSSSQGAWGVPGRSAADLLRSAANNGRDVQSAREQGSATEAGDAELGSSAVPLSASAVDTMVAMGIDGPWAACALRRCGGSDVSRAVDFCFSHDMKALVGEDEAHASSPAQPDADSDMAFAMALDQEERRISQARRAVAAASLSAEEGTFGPKVRVGGNGYATARRGAAALNGVARPPPVRWSAADVDMSAGEGGGERGTPPPPSDYDVESEDEKGTNEKHGGDEGRGDDLRAVPGGGRRKGKMPLFKNSAGEVVSKHDAVICGRMNARDASNFEGVGDLTAAGVRLSNRTFNSLKRDIHKKKEKGMVAGERVEGATRSTQEGVMDARTRLLVFKMVNAGTLLEVHGMVKTGKEAHVYHALAPEDADTLKGVRGVALKIFKTTLNEFGNRAAYVDGDPRYGSMKFNKQSRSKMFTIWAKKEHRNLIRLHRSGIPCPEPIFQREHTLVMSFVGEDYWPAPQLRELDLSASRWRRCYAQVLELMRLMFLRCRLVHADLSEYNVLYHERVCYVIDVGQAVDTGHAKAREFLARDVLVVTDFFRRKGVSACLDASVAEEFVLSYRGPSHVGPGQFPGIAAGLKGDDEEGPPTGMEIVSQLMGTPADEAGAALRDACASAQPWADRAASHEEAAAAAAAALDEDPNDFYRRDDEHDHDAPEHHDDADDGNTEEDGGHQDEGERDVDGGAGTRDGEAMGCSADQERALENDQRHDCMKRGQDATVIAEVGTSTDDGQGGGGRRGGAAALGSGARAKGKVELGERERARTADVKQALRAGIF